MSDKEYFIVEHKKNLDDPYYPSEYCISKTKPMNEKGKYKPIGWLDENKTKI